MAVGDAGTGELHTRNIGEDLVARGIIRDDDWASQPTLRSNIINNQVGNMIRRAGAAAIGGESGGR